MRMFRVVVLGVIAIAVGGAGYVYRDQAVHFYQTEVAHRLGLGAAASAAEKTMTARTMRMLRIAYSLMDEMI